MASWLTIELKNPGSSPAICWAYDIEINKLILASKLKVMIGWSLTSAHVAMRDPTFAWQTHECKKIALIRMRRQRESMALNDQLQVATVQKEKYGTKDGAGVHHTPWSRVMRKKIRLARAVAPTARVLPTC